MAKEGARNREFNIKVRVAVVCAMLGIWVHPKSSHLTLQTRSHLYKSDGALVGTYQRIDIPILRQFDQYNYVLFTGACLFVDSHNVDRHVLTLTVQHAVADMVALAVCPNPPCCRLRCILSTANEAGRLGHAAASSTRHGVSTPAVWQGLILGLALELAMPCPAGTKWMTTSLSMLASCCLTFHTCARQTRHSWTGYSPKRTDYITKVGFAGVACI